MSEPSQRASELSLASMGTLSPQVIQSALDAERADALREAAGDVGMGTVNEAAGKLLAEFKVKDQRIAELEAENKDISQIFALQYTRMGEATALWRAAHPGKELVLPDLGDLLAWLLKRIAELEEKFRKQTIIAQEFCDTRDQRIAELEKALKDAVLGAQTATKEMFERNKELEAWKEATINTIFEAGKHSGGQVMKIKEMTALLDKIPHTCQLEAQVIYYGGTVVPCPACAWAKLKEE